MWKSPLSVPFQSMPPLLRVSKRAASLPCYASYMLAKHWNLKQTLYTLSGLGKYRYLFEGNPYSLIIYHDRSALMGLNDTIVPLSFTLPERINHQLWNGHRGEWGRTITPTLKFFYDDLVFWSTVAPTLPQPNKHLSLKLAMEKGTVYPWQTLSLNKRGQNALETAKKVYALWCHQYERTDYYSQDIVTYTLTWNGIIPSKSETPLNKLWRALLDFPEDGVEQTILSYGDSFNLHHTRLIKASDLRYQGSSHDTLAAMEILETVRPILEA